jgi:hypothetical protein
VAKAGYRARTEGQVASAAAGTAKTILAVIAPAQFGIDLKGFTLSFDGVTASEKPVLVEIVKYTADGTGTAVTVDQIYGRTIAAGFTAKKAYSPEPTGATVIWPEVEWDPNKGALIYDFPLGETPDTAVSELIGIRVTVPTGGAVVNVRASMKFERT